MKAPRILIFSLAYFPRLVGGAEVAVKEITDRIGLSEIQFEMITIGDGSSPKEEQIGNVKVMRIFRRCGPLQKLLFPFVAYFKGMRLVDRYRYDAVWGIMASYAGFAAYLVKKAHPEVKFVLTIQEGDHFERRKGIWKPLFTKIFKSADRITSISKYLAGWSKEMGATCPIDIIPNAVDFELFSQEIDESERDELKKKLCKKPGDVFLITTSRLVEKNAVGDIIQSLLSLPKNIKLLVLGSGPLETSLRHLALKTGLNYMDEPPINEGNRVHFLGYVPHKEMPRYLSASDIFIRPSLTEGFGNSFPEAMAAGVPIIATPVGGIPDFLSDGETGLFCEVRNPKSIAQKVEKYLKDVESRAYIISKAKALVKERYQWKAIAPNMKKALLNA